MNEGQGPKGIVVGHGAMARGLVDAVRRIAGGPADTLEALSNEGLGPEDTRSAIDRLAGDDPVIVFVDLHAGSCCTAALASCRTCTAGSRAVLTGVNLPMLLEFVFHRSDPFDELVERLADRGRAAIRPVRMDQG